jgi:DNA mismatch repair protein MutS
MKIDKDINIEISVKNYFNIWKYFKDIYGNNVVILMQVGSFHECYSTLDKGGDINYIADILDFMVTKKNKNLELSEKNPYMIGAPAYNVDEIIEKLITNNFVVVRIDQISEPPNPKRGIVGIFSPSTYVEKQSNKKLNLVSFYFDIFNKNNRVLLSCGITTYDLSTGDGYMYETVSKENDEIYILDDIVRFLESFQPSEVIIEYSDNLRNKINSNEKIIDFYFIDILNYIGINNINKYSIGIDKLKLIKKVSYQKELINSIYGNLDYSDYDHILSYHLSRQSLINLLYFINNNQVYLVRSLSIPKLFQNKNTLYLGNKSLEQLDVINSGKNKSLFKILDNTKTPMGRRFLENTITCPLYEINKLNERYDLIEFIINNNIHNIIKEHFVNIYDIDKLTRRLVLKNIHPCELYNLTISFEQIVKIFTILNKFNINFNIDNNRLDKINDLLYDIKTNFDVDYIINKSFRNYKEEEYNFIKSNEELTKISDDIKYNNNFLSYLAKELEKYIDDKKFMNKNNDIISLKYNDRDGHYLLLTTRRSRKLKEGLKNLINLKIGSIKIELDDLLFQDMPKSNNTKITCKQIKNTSSNVVELKIKLATLIKDEFYKIMDTIYNKYNNVMKYISNKIAYFDFLISGAMVATKYGYTKPIIKEYENSYFEAENMRHPIVEIINQDIEYKPHNISIGKDKIGILLYGINSSGKSTLMKSIGLNIIMAQIGYYTACSKFEYNPYKSIMTRICGNDNIFKGMSSFMVEMMELMAILKRNNMNTLVLGDEICRGTEEKSANIIVSYMLERLQESKSSFITATHLHQIAEMNSVVLLQNCNPKVIPMHLFIEYDESNEKLIYSRQLCEGQGDKYYGVMVAKFLMRNDKFNIRTKELEEEYENIRVKTSNYNSNSLMIECYICKTKKDLETHHINFQKDFESGLLKNKKHIKKDYNYNLVTLCRQCHDKVDNNNIIINGWNETSDGRELDYYHNQNISKKKKYTKSDIKKILQLKELNLPLTKAKVELKNKYNFTISERTIKKIWNNNYL